MKENKHKKAMAQYGFTLMIFGGRNNLDIVVWWPQEKSLEGFIKIFEGKFILNSYYKYVWYHIFVCKYMSFEVTVQAYGLRLDQFQYALFQKKSWVHE